MRILALEPFYGGSHRAFLDGWIQRSAHQWTVLGLPDYKWKWRMRHAGLTLARQLQHQGLEPADFDLLWASDMLHLPEFLGLAELAWSRLPSVIYFHENQLTYPTRVNEPRDLHFAFSNFLSAVAADQVWFNSQFHRESFLTALRPFLQRMPDHQPIEEIAAIDRKASVQWPAIRFPDPQQVQPRPSGPLRILWSARWEHDKNPGDFFLAIEQLQAQQVDFRLDVIGQSFRTCPDEFPRARQMFASRIDAWGYQTRDAYWRILDRADVFVSTATHEFFGLSALEAIAAGAMPLLPARLAYPELLAHAPDPGRFFYDGSPQHLADRLAQVANAKRQNLLGPWAEQARAAIQRFDWPHRIQALDRAIASASDKS